MIRKRRKSPQSWTVCVYLPSQHRMLADHKNVDDTLAEAGEGDEEEEDEEGEEEYAAGMPASDGKDLNSQLAIGYKFDRSFVVRGNRIGVFKHTDDDKLEFATTINKVATPKGKEFSPRKVGCAAVNVTA